MRIFGNRLIIISLISILFMSAPAEDAKEIIKKVQEKYESIQDLKADFQQIQIWTLTGVADTVKGKLYLKKEDYFRIETGSQVIVTDGKSVWNYTEEKKQIIIDKIEEEGEYFLPKDFIFTFPQNYKPTYVEENKKADTILYTVHMEAKSDDELYLYFQAKVESPAWLIKEIKLTDINENDTYLKLDNIEIDTNLDKDLFTIKERPGVEIIDMRY